MLVAEVVSWLGEKGESREWADKTCVIAILKCRVCGKDSLRSPVSPATHRSGGRARPSKRNARACKTRLHLVDWQSSGIKA